MQSFLQSMEATYSTGRKILFILLHILCKQFDNEHTCLVYLHNI